MTNYLNNIRVFFLLSLITPFILNALSLEIRYAGLYPTSNLFRHLYGNSSSWQLEVDQPMPFNLSVWSNLDYLSRGGEEKTCSVKTNVKILNLSLGLKYWLNYNDSTGFYIGLGPTLAKTQIKNKGHCFDEHDTRLSVGAILKTGVTYFFYKNMFLDIFVDYLYLPVHFKKHSNVGGFKPGVGLGLRF